MTNEPKKKRVIRKVKPCPCGCGGEIPSRRIVCTKQWSRTPLTLRDVVSSPAADRDERIAAMREIIHLATQHAQDCGEQTRLL